LRLSASGLAQFDMLLTAVCSFCNAQSQPVRLMKDFELLRIASHDS
jgi:hypothetical protein